LLQDFASVDGENAVRVVWEIDRLLAVGPPEADLALLHIPPGGRDPREGVSTTDWLGHLRDVLGAPVDSPPTQ